MGRVYATTDRPGDEPVLAYIECDGCGARLKPGPHVVNSGWKKEGLLDEHGRNIPTAERTYCPDCVYERDIP
jgi:hypothetical protein